MAHLTPFHRAAAELVATAAGVPVDDVKVELPPRAELGDLAVGCFPIAKAHKTNPVVAAKAIAAAFVPNELLASATAAGPYVNFKLHRAAAFRWVIGAALDGTLVPSLGAAKTICIDYSSPNISKELAFHHVRSTGIGHALAQIFRALGYRVVGINHLGDWGTTHGMLIDAWLRWGKDLGDAPLDIASLNALYVRWREQADVQKRDPDEFAAWMKAILAGGDGARGAIDKLVAADAAARAFAAGGAAWFAKLEAGDAQAREIWNRFRTVSWTEFEAIYKQLGIEFEEVRGESAYEDDLAGVIAELRDRQLLEPSEGAQVVTLPDETIPVMIVKSDGASTYATRDFASAKYRWNTYQFERSLYVVAREQALHFRQVWKLLLRAGYDWAARCEHISFGLVRIGGKKSSTRAGGAILLRDVLDEAKARALAKMAEPGSPSAQMPLAQAVVLAEQIGTGAVLFANLVTQREKDVDFEWDRALAAEGDSGVYLQYSHARCASIMRKASASPTNDVDHALLVADAEWAVAKRLLDFGDIVARAGAACEPHLIAHYLLDLAAEFSRWYNAGSGDPSLKVVRPDDLPLQGARIALAGALQKTMATGLSLLGIAAPDQM